MEVFVSWRLAATSRAGDLDRQPDDRMMGAGRRWGVGVRRTGTRRCRLRSGSGDGRNTIAR